MKSFSSNEAEIAPIQFVSFELVSHFISNSVVSLNVTHHLQEFLKVNLTVTILINLRNSSLQLFLGVDILEFVAR